MRRLAALVAVGAVLFGVPSAEATFRGRDGLIAFARSVEGKGNPTIQVIRPDGTGLRRVRWSPPPPGRHFLPQPPQWSPDGRALAYSWWDPTNLDTGRDRIMIARPWNERRPSFFAYGGAPAWSPSGRSLAFVRHTEVEERHDGNTLVREFSHIDVKRVASGSKRRLTTWEETSLWGLSWSPDGSRIVFDENTPGATGHDRDLYTITTAGGDESPLVEDPDEHNNADWHPDGSRLVLQCERNTYFDELCIVDASGPGPDFSGIRYLMEDDKYDSYPEWSPSGRWIVWAREGDLWVMRADGTKWRRLTRGRGLDYGPTWQPRPRR